MDATSGSEAALADEIQQLRAQVASLELERQILKQVVEEAPVMIAVVRAPDFVYELVNPTFQALAPGKELVGRRFADVWADLPDPLLDVLQNVIASGLAFHQEDTRYVIDHGPGIPPEAVYVSYSLIPLLNAQGKPDRVLTLGHDVTAAVRQREELTHSLTELRRAEESQRLSLERLQKVLAIETVGVMFWDLETGCMVDANDTFLRMMGYSRSEVEGRELSWQKLTPPEYVDVSRAEVETFLVTGRVGPYEKEYFCNDGTRKWLLFAGSSLGNNRCVEFCVDISARKRTEQALRDSEAQFRALANTIPQLCWMANADGWIFWYNERWYEYTGTTPKDMEGWGWQSVHDPDVLPTVLERWRTSVSSGQPFDMVFPLRGGDGIFRPFLTRVMPMHNEAGKVVRWFGSNTDISEQLKAQDELQRLTDALDLSQTMIWDQDGTILYASAGACRLYGTTQEEMVGKRSHEFLQTEFPYPLEQIERDLARDSRWAGELKHVRRDGSEIWVASYWALEHGWHDSRPVVIEVNNDITELKGAENKIVQLNSQLENRVADRTAELRAANQELEAFAYSVSHDLRAPLRGIDGWSLALVEDYGEQLDSRAQQYLQRVRSETQRMGLLIDDLLELSRVSRQEMKRVPADLSALAHSVALRLMAENSTRKINFVIQSQLSGVVDGRLIDVVLTNLFSNAIKFTGTRPEAHIEFGQIEANGEGAFYVKDNGVGFDMAHADMLFGAFQRLHKSSEFAGTGIGLATVQRIVRRHGGRVWAEAQAEHGATFYFTLRTASAQARSGERYA